MLPFSNAPHALTRSAGGCALLAQRRLFLSRLLDLHGAGKLTFFGKMAGLTDRHAFVRHLTPARKKRCVVYAKPPFARPQAMLAYLSRYTHRVAISNSRLIAFDQTGVTFRYKDYRRTGVDRQQVMTLAVDEFIRRFLIHVLPRGFHRIRHYGLLAGSSRKGCLAQPIHCCSCWRRLVLERAHDAIVAIVIFLLERQWIDKPVVALRAAAEWGEQSSDHGRDEIAAAWLAAQIVPEPPFAHAMAITRRGIKVSNEFRSPTPHQARPMPAGDKPPFEGCRYRPIQSWRRYN